jgi:hypothetical protein
MRLFHANIADFFGLHTIDQNVNTPATWARLIANSGKNQMPTPLWMGKLL